VKGSPSHIAEGFGRFSPPDFARFVVVARASLMESQNHLIDAQDRGYISQETRDELNALAQVALKEATGLIEYLQSPEALRNAGRARGRGIKSWLERRDYQAAADPKTGEVPRHPEARSEHEHEPGSRNPDE
jgi:hypothetical protein